MKLRELRGLTELLTWLCGRVVTSVDEHCYDIHDIPSYKGHSAKATFSDGSELYVVTSYDADYSEVTPGEGAEVAYWVRECRGGAEGCMRYRVSDELCDYDMGLLETQLNKIAADGWRVVATVVRLNHRGLFAILERDVERKVT